MNIQPQQSISDDQELAKVLAGITAGADGAAPTNLANDLEEEAADKKTDESSTKDTANPGPEVATDTTASKIDTIEATVATDQPISPIQPISTPMPSPAANSGLESIKQDALNELRPLVDKLNISAEEKFDTYLLIIRSTDDSSLVAPAFAAARAIADEAGKAQALFEIVKEIDYLSNPQKPTA